MLRGLLGVLLKFDRSFDLRIVLTMLDIFRLTSYDWYPLV